MLIPLLSAVGSTPRTGHMQLLHCLLHSYLPYSTAVHYGIHYSSACSYLPQIVTALKLLRRIDLISCRLRTVRNHTLKSTSKLEAQSFFCRKQFSYRSPDYGSGWSGCYKCPSPQDVVEYSCASVNGSGSRTYNGASRAGKMYQLCTTVSP